MYILGLLINTVMETLYRTVTADSFDTCVRTMAQKKSLKPSPHFSVAPAALLREETKKKKRKGLLVCCRLKQTNKQKKNLEHNGSK